MHPGPDRCRLQIGLQQVQCDAGGQQFAPVRTWVLHAKQRQAQKVGFERQTMALVSGDVSTGEVPDLTVVGAWSMKGRRSRYMCEALPPWEAPDELWLLLSCGWTASPSSAAPPLPRDQRTCSGSVPVRPPPSRPLTPAAAA